MPRPIIGEEGWFSPELGKQMLAQGTHTLSSMGIIKLNKRQYQSALDHFFPSTETRSSCKCCCNCSDSLNSFSLALIRVRGNVHN